MKTNQSSTKKYLSFSGVLFLSVMFVTGCVEEPDPTAARSANQNAAGKIPAPHALNNDGFVTPLFGLATAPNGDILVADAGAGVAHATGALEIPLPGITGIAPLGRGSMWALTGAECGSSPDCVKVFDGGFTSIIDLAFDADGMLYVAEIDEQSWFAVEVLGGGVGGTISSCDLSTLAVEEVASGIPNSRRSRSGRTGPSGLRRTP